MNLKLITEKEAQYLMMAPAVMGGWVMTDPDAQLAAEDAIRKIADRHNLWGGKLALWSGSEGVDLNAEEKALIVAEFSRRANTPTDRRHRCLSDMYAAATEWLKKIESAATL